MPCNRVGPSTRGLPRNKALPHNKALPSYRSAIEDALVIEDSELLPLVTLRPDDPMVRYDDSGTKVLLLNVHSLPQTLVAPARMLLLFNLWTFTDLEFLFWLKSRGAHYQGCNWPLRLNQLLGMPAQRASTHVSGFWVKPEFVIRPAYSFNVFTPIATASFEATVNVYRALDALSHAAAAPATAPIASGPEREVPALAWHEVLRRARRHGAHYWSWFEHQALVSYSLRPGCPWTRLGYTYDWGNAQHDDSLSKYGLSEFLIPLGTAVDVAFTVTIAEFIAAAQQDYAPLWGK